MFGTAPFITDSNSRQQLLLQYANAIPENVLLLEDYCKLKNGLATCLGYKNYSEYAMYNTLVKEPAKLNTWLKTLLSDIQPFVVQTVDSLKQ